MGEIRAGKIVLSDREKMKKIILLVLYTVFLIWGLCVCKDYGISVDERLQRNHGLVSFKHVYQLVNGNDNMPDYLQAYPPLNEYDHKYYGVAIKIPLILVEYFNDFQMTNQQIYQMNHLYTFLLFFMASVFMYKLSKRLQLGFSYSVLSVILFVICPRILADSFYNIKDSVFLSLFTIMMYFGLSVISEFKLKYALGLAVSAAFCLNTRIVGALPLFIICLVYIFKDGKFVLKRFLHIAATGLLSFGIYILVSPASWSNFADYIYNVVAVFSDYIPMDKVTLGKTSYAGNNLPWYYTILCICMTMPNLYLISGATGFVTEIKSLLCARDKKIYISKNLLMVTMLIQFIAIMSYDMILKPVKYNMWRHFYFLFVFIVIFSVSGIKYMTEHMPKFRILVTGWAAASVILTIGWIIVNHPYEYVYYNILYPTNTEDTMHHDYWALSDFNLLKGLQDNDINLYPHNDVCTTYFGEEGWEKYSVSKEPYGAEYRFWKQGEKNILYREEEGIEVGRRKISGLVKRINYNNCLLKYALNSSGEIAGENRGQDIKWEYTVSGPERCITAEIPEGYNIFEIDFLHPQNQFAESMIAYASDDGINWVRYNSTRQVFSEKGMFSVITQEPMRRFLMIKYEMGEIKNEDSRFLIRVYGDRNDMKAGSEIAGDRAYCITDRDMNTCWTTGAPQKRGQSIDLQLKKEKIIRGIRIISDRDYSRKLEIQYKDADGEYKNIPYSTDDNEIYMFSQPVRCSELRLVNQSDLELWWWTIYELELYDEEVYRSDYPYTRSVIKDIHSNYNSEMLWNMLDNSMDSVWSAGEIRNHDMYIELELEPESVIAGFRLSPGASVFECAGNLMFMGSDDGNSWNEIMYNYGSASDYVFEEECDYSFYRIIQTEGDDFYTWSVAELGILRAD